MRRRNDEDRCLLRRFDRKVFCARHLLSCDAHALAGDPARPARPGCRRTSGNGNIHMVNRLNESSITRYIVDGDRNRAHTCLQRGRKKAGRARQNHIRQAKGRACLHCMFAVDHP
jgi:hypothetical protein